VAVIDTRIDTRSEELGETIPYPGPFAKLSQTPLSVAGRAPHIGEHNTEVYEGLLGYSQEQLAALRTLRAV
jgi:crotonobetainyl-CoA:carnitine CoA-transferase CaiB-like acyl-CoA transferase